MIYGNINSPMYEDQAAVLPPLLREVLRFLKETDLAAHEPGVFDLELLGEKLILQVLDLKTSPREALRPEIHIRNVDVQFLASGGPEWAGFDALGRKERAVSENLLDTPRDILFYEDPGDQTEGRLYMEPGSYVMYFPWDVHIPAVAQDGIARPIRKIVVKVPVKALTACVMTPREPQKSIMIPAMTTMEMKYGNELTVVIVLRNFLPVISLSSSAKMIVSGNSMTSCRRLMARVFFRTLPKKTEPKKSAKF